jgi:hypothetical protein
MELEEFLNKYDITLDRAQDSDWMDDEYTKDYIKLAIQRAAKKAALGRQDTHHHFMPLSFQKYQTFLPELLMN